MDRLDEFLFSHRLLHLLPWRGVKYASRRPGLGQGQASTLRRPRASCSIERRVDQVVRAELVPGGSTASRATTPPLPSTFSMSPSRITRVAMRVPTTAG